MFHFTAKTNMAERSTKLKTYTNKRKIIRKKNVDKNKDKKEERGKRNRKQK